MGTVLTIIVAIGIIWLILNLTGWLFGLIIWLAVAGFAGYFASRVLGGDGIGTVGNILLGLAGGLVGPLMMSFLDVKWLQNPNNFIANLIASFIGAVVVIFVGRFFNKNFAK
jgi:uncharacterized membrane protein YeaQ/YmgE (transglycosylase-associated protein family)